MKISESSSLLPLEKNRIPLTDMLKNLSSIQFESPNHKIPAAGKENRNQNQNLIIDPNQLVDTPKNKPPMTMTFGTPVSYASTNNTNAAIQKIDEYQELKLNKRLVRAIYDFQAKDIDEMSIKVGEKFVLLGNQRFEDEEQGWLKGKNVRTSQIGLFPRGYVDFVA